MSSVRCAYYGVWQVSHIPPLGSTFTVVRGTLQAHIHRLSSAGSSRPPGCQKCQPYTRLLASIWPPEMLRLPVLCGASMVALLDPINGSRPCGICLAAMHAMQSCRTHAGATRLEFHLPSRPGRVFVPIDLICPIYPCPLVDSWTRGLGAAIWWLANLSRYRGCHLHVWRVAGLMVRDSVARPSP